MRDVFAREWKWVCLWSLRFLMTESSSSVIMFFSSGYGHRSVYVGGRKVRVACELARLGGMMVVLRNPMGRRVGPGRSRGGMCDAKGLADRLR